MAKKEYGESGHLSIFTLKKHLMMLLKYNFFRVSFLHIIKDTDSMTFVGPCSSDFFLSKECMFVFSSKIRRKG